MSSPEQQQAKEEAEELVGIIRAASGKARLLSSQKMNQFQGEFEFIAERMTTQS